MLEILYELIPKHLLPMSGSVFYSGRNAFTGQKDIYILGLNPGGDPGNPEEDTVGSHALSVINDKPDDWSEYRDESWQGKPPGTFGMQPRVLHLLRNLNLSPGQVPASNLVFFRSTSADKVNKYHMDECWPFHEYAIEKLKPKAILCFGKSAGAFVRIRLGANKHIAQFIEKNYRKWPSCAYTSPSGIKVIELTHPSRAKWDSEAADPSEMVKRVLNI